MVADDATETDAPADTPALIVGAGPTGLAAALALHAAGVPFRIIDRAPDHVHESRALAVQARTLEVLDAFGVADDLVAAGNPNVMFELHSPAGGGPIGIFEAGPGMTRYPFILFLAQGDSERLLLERLTALGVTVERETTLLGLVDRGDAADARLRGPAGDELVTASWVIGCDGAHSAVRDAMGIPFTGSPFPQAFALADLEADGLERGRAHLFLAEDGLAFFFPLEHPATWRMLTLLPDGVDEGGLTLATLQRVIARYSDESIVLRDPVWLTDFQVANREAGSFRSGRVFLAGDAAHIHTPAGGQGMNTGIQDAVNLAWKLGLVHHGASGPGLLDSYASERMPVARAVLEATGRAFGAATSRAPVAGFLRSRVIGRAAPVVTRLRPLRRLAFRAVSELVIGYPGGPLGASGGAPIAGGPAPGDRVPDLPVVVGGEPVSLHRLLDPARFRLLLVGDVPASARTACREVAARHPLALHPDPIVLHRTVSGMRRPGSAGVFGRARGGAVYLLRPDGYVAFRAGGLDVAAAGRHLDEILA
ncbi:FAD-binding monooxygenase [Agromyces rhizosphaerae]|uniref:FAD-binding monooxygenase n=1 Tax=Agromyces rhizosphaerae TaxID=88374 RepID=A0A9W6CY21_9MICO|nr:FAD-dependent monooxygenase [Agromyces rhizosphaerae]GLI27337.1 FAD-binding monooxygenase [Agromyces rhizosphaerae]